MIINKIDNYNEYATFLQGNTKELQALFEDILIKVTSFFREPKTFEALNEKVFPELTKNLSANATIRIWIPGCSTGEEAYSVTIAIQEFLEQKGLAKIQLQIFGTDANEKNLEKARQGTYPKTIEEHVSEKRLTKFFTIQNGNYQITKLIRDMCIFAKQDITHDPPFSKLDLIICRNVLIYFDLMFHEKVFQIFHFGLKPNRFLVLGESESIGKFQNLFEPISNKSTIYTKKQIQPPNFRDPDTSLPYAFQRKTVNQPEKPNSMLLLKEEVNSLLMAKYVPPTLIVNNNLDILSFHGQVNPYLIHEPGTASLNVKKIVQKDLRAPIQTAVYLARKTDKPFKETVQFKKEGKQKTVTIQVKALKTADYEDAFFCITFEEKTLQRDNSPAENGSVTALVEKETSKDNQVNDLRGELESTKASLQTIIEVQEATNEELRSTMEEAQSGNEELQSTNEELETAKEEMQAGNEELHTLNEELRNRNQVLSQLNDDLNNLQLNVDFPVIIVDVNLKIRRFTAQAQELLNILPSNVGQTISSSNPWVNISDLEKTINEVLTKLTPVNREVAGTSGRWFEMRIRPYLTEHRKIDGAVLSFLDVTESKKAAEKLNQLNSKITLTIEKLHVISSLTRHDVRNKLSTLNGYAYLIRKKHGDQADIVEGLGKMEKAVEDSFRLFDFAKAYEEIGMEELVYVNVRNAVAEAGGLSPGSKFKVVNECEGLKVRADSSLKQLFYNFIDNTKKHGEKTTTVSVHYERADSGELRIIYEDDGVGISAENKAKLFTEGFSTGGSTGFGLFLTKKMVDVYGWTIQEKGEPGKGAKFVITIPKLNNNGLENYQIDM